MGYIGRMTEGCDFAINGIFDGTDLDDEVMHRVWFSISVLVKSRSKERRSSYATLHCCPESVQSLSRRWKYTRRDSLMSPYVRRQARR